MFNRIKSISKLSKQIIQSKGKIKRNNMCSINQKPNPNLNYEVLPTPTKSENDKKTYKVIRLPNGLIACLVSDTTNVCLNEIEEESESDDESLTSDDEEVSSTEESENPEDEEDADCKPRKIPDKEQKMAATGLCIGVGSFSDIKEIPGLAHFLEHMVFMGSKKFPQENDFDSFIKKKGGFDNAATDCETTVFYFECLEKHLFKALDKFAQFFISPLMKRTSMTREREAIESEFQMSLPSDSARKEQLLFNLFNSEVPVNQFTWGNLKTLRDDVTDDFVYEKLHEFRKKHYSAHRMTLAIQARLPMDVLEDYVLKCFSDVSNNNIPPDNFEIYQGKIFDNTRFAKLYHVEPVSETLQVDLVWALPSLLKKYKTKPQQYISWLLGHEGKGSLISYLRKKMWVLAIFTGNDESGTEHNSMYALFTVHMTLTREGYNHLADILTAMFSYIKLIRADENIFKEIQLIEETSFRFAEEEDPIDFVEDLCEAMYFYPPQDYLTGSDLFFEYSPEDINFALSYLTPHTMNITVLDSQPSADVNYNLVEPWFGTKYTVRDIPKEWLQTWQEIKVYPEFHLPEPNPFLTTNFDLLHLDKVPEYPEKILVTDTLELWYKKDEKFKLPIAYYYFNFNTPFMKESPLNECLTEIFIFLLNFQLVEEAYPAGIAQLTYKIQPSDKGFTIKVYGFNEKIPILIELIGKYLVSVADNLTEEMFEAIKDKLMKSFHNKFIKPAKFAKELRMSLLLDTYWSSIDKYQIINTITFDMMKQHCKSLTSNLYVQALVQGNASGETAINTAQNLIKIINCKSLNKDQRRYYRVYQLPTGSTFCKIKSFNMDDTNSIITNYYQSGPFNLKESVIIDLIMMIIEEPLFDTLRTKEQLGYDVHCTSHDTFGVIGYSITVNAQAVKNTVLYVDNRIETFVKTVSKMLKKLPEKKFNQIKIDLIKVKQCADTHLKDEVNRNWTEIMKEEYFFNRAKEEIKAIESVKAIDVRKWWDNNNLSGCSKTCRKLSVQVEGHNIKMQNEENHVNNVKQAVKAVTTDNCVDEVHDNCSDKSYKIELIDNGPENKDYYVKSISSFQGKLPFYPRKCENS